MKKFYAKKIKVYKNIKQYSLLALMLMAFSFYSYGQSAVPFSSRANYTVQGDFTIIGNTNLAPINPGAGNDSGDMFYVDVDGESSTVNSSSADINLLDDSGQAANNSDIVYAGLYWTGRPGPDQTFVVNTDNGPKTLNKAVVSLKGPSSSYTTITANTGDIYYPESVYDNMYIAFADVTEYVKQNGTGSYTVADIALLEGQDSSSSLGIGYYGGWSMVIVYQNTTMKMRNIGVFDGYSFKNVPGDAGYVPARYINLDISNLNTSDIANAQIGVMAGEGDANLNGDYLATQRNGSTAYNNRLQHNSTDNSLNFFNSTISVDGSVRNPSGNIFGLDLHKFDLPASSVAPGQDALSFQYVATMDKYVIYNLTLSFENNTLPTPPEDATYECLADVPAGESLSAMDNCSPGNMITSLPQDRVNSSDPCNVIITRTWSFTDSCGNTSQVSQTINVVDTTAPIAPEAPADVTVACLTDVPADLELEAIDNCGDIITATGVDTVVASDGTCNQSVIRTWTFADACGNTSEVTQNILVVDDVAPIFIDGPQDLVYDCDGEQRNPTVDAWVELNGYALAEDNCSDITWTNNYNGESLTCNESVTVEFTATDACGNSISQSATYTLNDDTAPTIDTEPTDLVLECNENSESTLNTWLTSNGGALATDICSAEVSWTNDFDPAAFTLEACGADNATTVTFSTYDDCGNIATTTATITVIDETAPTVPTNVPADVTVECYEDIPAMINLTATDFCAGEITVPGVDTENNTDPTNIIITRTWTFADACGNTSEVSQVITVNDQTAPVLDGAAPADLALECVSDVPAMEALTATDNCSGTITSNGTETINDTDACNIIITRNWIFADESGNTTEVSQTITVKDETVPVVDNTPADITLDCSDEIPAIGSLTATDNCAGIITSQGTETVDDSNPINTIITRTWTFADACGNTTEAIQTITVEKDVTAPIVDNAPTDVTLECIDDVPPMEALTATDDCSGVITSNGTETINDADACNVIITRNWVFTDNSGNSTEVSQTITVKDETAPVVDNTPANITLNCSDEIPAIGSLTATDNCAGTITSQGTETVDDSNPINTIITRTWTFADACGNTTEATQTITVEKDITAPVVDNAPADVTLECIDDVPSMEALTATDDCSGIITSNGTETINDADACNVIITRNWVFTDNSGNSTEVSQTITVADTQAPIVPTIPADVTIDCADELPAMIDLTAQDNCGAMVTASPVDVTNDTDACNIIITRTWTFEDVCGNVSTGSQIINVIDETAPTFIAEATDIVFNCDGEQRNPTIDAWVELNGYALAQDNCSEVTWTNNYDSTADICNGAVEVIFTATDACGNSVNTAATYTIIDELAPEITTQAQDITLECGDSNITDIQNWLNTNGGAMAQDVCSDVIWSNDFDSSALDNASDVTVTFTASDACGNMSTTSATIILTDNIAPIIETPAQDLVVECNENATDVINVWLTSNGGATATDNCSDITWTNDFTSGATTVTFTATDANGNVVTTTATITYMDDSAPILDTPAQDLVVECNEDATDVINAWLATNGGATATDYCSDIIWTNDFTSGATTVTFTATDANGNSVTTTATITYMDDSAPILDTPAQDIVVECNENPEDIINAWLTSNGGATATDYCSDITWSNDFTFGATTVTFTATDANGNSVTTSATITYMDDTAPILETPAQDLVVECNENATDVINAWLANNGGATAIDYCTDITWTNDFTEDATTVTFTVTDAAGNFVTTTATITYIDETAPVVDNTPVDATYACIEDVPTLDSLTATDACDGTITDAGTETIDNADACNVTITRTWMFTDASNNSTTVTQVIMVIDDVAPTASAPADVTVECTDDIPAMIDITATDNCGATITSTGVDTVNDIDSCTSIITRVWSFTDACGNTAEVSQIITVADVTAPVLVNNLDTDITVNCAAIPDQPVLEFADNCSATVNVVFTEDNTSTGADYENYQVIRDWTVSDSCGNTSVFTQTINVNVQQAPVLESDTRCTEGGSIDLDSYLVNPDTDGTWVVDSGDATVNGSTFNPIDVEVGTYVFTFTEASGCLNQTTVTIYINEDCVEPTCDPIISTAVTPNGDSHNEYFTVTGLDRCGFVIDIEMYNRWGALVFKTQDYQNNWNGQSGKGGFGNADTLPSGTYYYIVTIKNSGLKPLSGSIYLGTK